ncbi:MAG: hypothetical protein QM804_06860 [Propionicimonas sp.]
MGDDRDVVLERLTNSCELLVRRSSTELSLRDDLGMRVEVEWIEKRTPLLREVYAVAGVEGETAWGEVTLVHKLTRRILDSASALDEVLAQVGQRMRLMGSAADAYRTAVAVMADRETLFGRDDERSRLVSWAALAYWAHAAVNPPSLNQYYEVLNEMSEALAVRFTDGVRNAWVEEWEASMPDTLMVDGHLWLPLVDPDSCVPRVLSESVAIAVSEAALITAGFR